VLIDYFLEIENQFAQQRESKSREMNAESFAAQVRGRGKHGR